MLSFLFWLAVIWAALIALLLFAMRQVDRAFTEEQRNNPTWR